MVPDRPVYEHRCRRRVHTAGEAADRLCVADLLPYLLDGVGDDVDRRPIRRAAADFKEKVLQDLHPELGVPDLWMELHPIEAFTRLLEGDNRDRRGLGGDGEALGRSEDGVAMTRPGQLLVGGIREEHTVLLDVQLRATVLPDLGRPDLPAHL